MTHFIATDISQDLKDAPIHAAWITDGAPRARNRILSRASDGSAWSMLWECSAGSFRWRYEIDETIHFLEGHVTITTEDGVTRSFGPGDVIFFPAGCQADWVIQERIRKLAFCQKPMPKPLQFMVRPLRWVDWKLRRAARRLSGWLADPAEVQDKRSASGTKAKFSGPV